MFCCPHFQRVGLCKNLMAHRWLLLLQELQSCISSSFTVDGCAAVTARGRNCPGVCGEGKVRKHSDKVIKCAGGCFLTKACEETK